MTALPRDRRIDSTLSLLGDGYGFISRRCRELDTDVFEARLLGQRTLCCSGAEVARIFYDTARMQRQSAMPGWVRNTLLGRGGVQGLDGVAHRHRKALFMELMSPQRLRELNALATEELRQSQHAWRRQRQVVLLDALEEVLCRAVCRWAGVPLTADEAPYRTRQVSAMIDGSGAIGWRHWQARRARKKADAWAAELVDQVRRRAVHVPETLPLARMAEYRDTEAKLLPSKVAGVELLNLLRPTVAVAYYVTFAALALYRYPVAGATLTGGDLALERFVQEVGRYYPFFPFAAARVRETFCWRNHPFVAGRRVLLDLYGTNHDPRLWPDPETFRPERFETGSPGAFELIPQGGGAHDHNHRCAGEWITIELMKVIVRFLTEEMSYRVPEQNLTVPLNRFPTRPESGFVIELLTAAGSPS